MDIFSLLVWLVLFNQACILLSTTWYTHLRILGLLVLLLLVSAYYEYIFASWAFFNILKRKIENSTYFWVCWFDTTTRSWDFSKVSVTEINPFKKNWHLSFFICLGNEAQIISFLHITYKNHMRPILLGRGIFCVKQNNKNSHR